MSAFFGNLDAVAGGFLQTLVLALISGIIALVLGTLIATCRVSPAPPLRAFGTAYVEIIRNTPLTIVFFFFVFVGPTIGLRLDFKVAAVVALSIYTATFVCEAVRSGINSVGIGQAEAARSIGMTFGQTLAIVVLPQAVRTVIPPIINVLIALVKNTSIAGAFGVTELFATSQPLIDQNASQVIGIFLGIAICYLILTIPLGVLAGQVEKRVAFAR